MNPSKNTPETKPPGIAMHWTKKRDRFAAPFTFEDRNTPQRRIRMGGRVKQCVQMANGQIVRWI